MAITDADLKKIGNLMDERLLVFHEEVVEPKFVWLEKKINKKIDNLETNLTNQIQKTERKLDQVTDQQSEKLDDHERRIEKLELSVVI